MSFLFSCHYVLLSDDSILSILVFYIFFSPNSPDVNLKGLATNYALFFAFSIVLVLPSYSLDVSQFSPKLFK